MKKDRSTGIMNRRKFISALALTPLAIKFAPALKWMEPKAVALGEWNNYTSFSSLSIESSIDETVMKVAEELGYQAGLSISAIYNQTLDYQPVSFRV
jgi:hypothetical protein